MASIGLLSTYPPTECGLATFTQALYDHLAKTDGAIGVVRVLDHADAHNAPQVVATLVNGHAGAIERAAAALNQFAVAVIQHEYGIYGGLDGRDLLTLLDALTVPTVVVLHTVLQEPTQSQREILARIVQVSTVLVTMTQTARQRVIKLYGADPKSVVLIPHGAIDNSGALEHSQVLDATVLPAKACGTPRPVILTWGLIGPGKGIEWAIDAVAELRDLDPLYLVMGKTHPKVRELHGERYRGMLGRRIEHLGLEHFVTLDPSYLSRSELARLVDSIDVVVLPYDSIEQVTSGVLIEAVAAGKPVVSTAFPHAVEMLSDGTGLLVDQRDPAGLAAALRRVIAEPGLAASLSSKASAKAPRLLWNSVADRYSEIAASLAHTEMVHSS